MTCSACATLNAWVMTACFVTLDPPKLARPRLQEIGRWCWQYCQDADGRDAAEAGWRATSATYDGVPLQSAMTPQHQARMLLITADSLTASFGTELAVTAG